MKERKYLKTKLPLCVEKQFFFWKCQMEMGSSNPKRIWRAINTAFDRTERPVQFKNTAVDFAMFFKGKVQKVRFDTANAAKPH